MSVKSTCMYITVNRDYSTIKCIRRLLNTDFKVIVNNFGGIAVTWIMKALHTQGCWFNLNKVSQNSRVKA